MLLPSVDPSNDTESTGGAHLHPPATTAGESGPQAMGGENDYWIVTCDLVRLDPSGAGSTNELVEDLVSNLLGHDPLASIDGSRIVVSLTVLGTATTAVPIAIERLWTALEACDAPGWQVARATQISYSDFDNAKATDEPIQLLCASECATLLEVSKQRVSQLIDLGDFPPPDAVVGGRPSWRTATIQLFKTSRRNKHVRD